MMLAVASVVKNYKLTVYYNYTTGISKCDHRGYLWPPKLQNMAQWSKYICMSYMHILDTCMWPPNNKKIEKCNPERLKLLISLNNGSFYLLFARWICFFVLAKFANCLALLRVNMKKIWHIWNKDNGILLPQTGMSVIAIFNKLWLTK